VKVGAPVPAHPHTASEPTDKASRAIHKEAQELEGVFLRKLIEESGVGKSTSASGYGSMAVDALSTALGKAGGLGLARMIEEALKSRKG
jgi:Rod binding domain-containing protein